MIFGECPYCLGLVTIEVPDGVKLPVMAKIECEHCKKEFFEKISRIDPQAYRLDEVEVDEAAKRIDIKQGGEDVQKEKD